MALPVRGHKARVTSFLARLAALTAIAALLGGCGSDDVERELGRAQERAEQVGDDVVRRVERARDQFERSRERFGRRIREVLADLEPLFERPRQTSPTVRSRGRNEPTTIEAFLTDVLRSVDRYWTATFRAADLPEPRVRYAWIAPEASVLTACGVPADGSVALYCSADDTIYVGQQFAADLYEGVLRGLPGEAAGFGRAAGDFAVAYVLAHEYAHNLQHELGVFNNQVGPTARPFELQADCLAGAWAYSVYAEGELAAGDLEEATNAALAVGDFDVGNAQHHGTPTERRDAVLAGFNSGDPSACQRYLPS
jgi:predicted metalloprotease